MELVDLLAIANDGYEDEYLSEYYDEKTGALKDGQGDTLARFIVVELRETYDDEAEREDQLEEAVKTLQKAQEDLQGCIDALKAAQHPKIRRIR
jgi:hypothetical protein